MATGIRPIYGQADGIRSSPLEQPFGILIGEMDTTVRFHRGITLMKGAGGIRHREKQRPLHECPTVRRRIFGTPMSGFAFGRRKAAAAENRRVMPVTSDGEARQFFDGLAVP